MNLLITICARGGSKGIPGKNIKVMNGLPLIAYTINSAQEFAEKNPGKVVLSTDSELIKEVASAHGLKSSYQRPADLATDTAGKLAVINDVLLFSEKEDKTTYDFVLDLDITSPLRTQLDLSQAFEKLKNNNEALNIFSVNHAARNPYFNMVEETKNGFVQLAKSGASVLSRQTAPKVYDMNASFYFYKRAFFEEGYVTPITDKSLVYVMDHICFDLDEPHDFTIMEIMMREKLFNFSF